MPTNENMIRAFQGKQNIGLNLKSEEGLALFYELVKRADIVMHNYRPGVPERLKIDYETLKAIKPDLVYVYASAYGIARAGPLPRRLQPDDGRLLGQFGVPVGRGQQAQGRPVARSDRRQRRRAPA